jgi:hypothetical protein
MLWKERNARTFRNEASCASDLTLKIVQEAELWLRSGYTCLSSLTALM